MTYETTYKLQFPGHNHPVEDAVAVSGNAVAVFDGVTLLHQKPYPDPSPAAEAARAGAEAAVCFAAAHSTDADFMLNSFKAASEAICRVNEQHGITEKSVDYLKVQYAAAVGALAVFAEGILYYGHVNDCGVMLCTPEGEVIDNLTIDRTNFDKFHEDLRRKNGFEPGNPAEHVYIRRHVVNNFALTFKDKPIEFPVLTGQPEALKGVYVRQRKITEPTMVLVYSDGFIPQLNAMDFRQKILAMQNPRIAKEYIDSYRAQTGYQKEASLVVGQIT